MPSLTAVQARTRPRRKEEFEFDSCCHGSGERDESRWRFVHVNVC